MEQVRRVQEYLKAKFVGVKHVIHMAKDAQSPVPMTAARDWFTEQVQSRRFNREENGKCIDDSLGIWGLSVQDDVCFWIGPPTYRYDEQGRVHCDGGPAITSSYHEWWYWHGVEVSKIVVLSPERISAKDIDSENNNEVKRIMLERWPGGWDKFLRMRGSLIERRVNERDGQTEMLFRHKNEVMFVVTDPSTGRRYALRVPVETKTCQEAQLWLSHGLDSRAVHRS